MSGTFQFQWTSMRTLYSVLVYLLTSCMVGYSTYVKFLNFEKPELPFDEYLITLIFIFALFPHWFFQLVSLPSSKGVAEYLTMWTRFQKHFLTVTGSLIELDYRAKFIAAQSVGTAMAVGIPISQTVLLGSFTLLESFGFYHVLTLSFAR
ncbi:uncharacterized protein LOC124296630 [Neodiprion lecontei]|uniref:Uncharacterized protein LOC124296630 n=1 Tax=Neodiprion lecontei TaxID=441921 RepID=A0ABM3GQW3_NEOLC|nr:uncharacterized protein LOC124224864 [Neodiprion pinetum]XP_046602651.1 uncharacterized protein LOC124296630 [Neodiprion lecontei]